MILNPSTGQIVKIDGRRGHNILKDLFRQNITFDKNWFETICVEYNVDMEILQTQYKKYMSNPFFVKCYRSFEEKDDDDGFKPGKIYNVHTGKYINNDSHIAIRIYKELFGTGIIYKNYNELVSKYKIPLEDLLEVKDKYSVAQMQNVQTIKCSVKNPRRKLWAYWESKQLDKLKLLLHQDNVMSFINSTNDDGLSLLYCIIDKYHKSYYDLIELLLIRGVDVNYCDEFEYETALFLCAEKNLVRVTELLLKYNANVNFTNAGNENALHSLLSLNRVEDDIIDMVHLLLKFNINPNIMNYRKKNCYDVAKENKYKNICAILKTHISDTYVKVYNKEIKDNVASMLLPINNYTKTIGIPLKRVWTLQKIIQSLVTNILDKHISYDELDEYVDNYMIDYLEQSKINIKDDLYTLLSKIKKGLVMLKPYLSKI